VRCRELNSSPNRRCILVTMRSPKRSLKCPSASPVSSLLLRACHVCHRRPTTRAVLDGYIDCEDCEKRTCFICLRECENEECRHAGCREMDAAINYIDYQRRPRSRRRRICSSCSVEKIDLEGEAHVTCLDCHIYASDLRVLLSHNSDADDRPSPSVISYTSSD
jgi:hypothetical protein